MLNDGTRRSAPSAGPAVGGLLAISFGSLAEIILAMFVLAKGEAPVVRAQITGSIIGTGLLGLGVAIVAGGIGRERQSFNRERAGQLSSLLILVVIALMLPAVFNLAAGARDLASIDERLSIGVSLVLLALYAANLVYTLVTHRDVFATGEPKESASAGWPLWLRHCRRGLYRQCHRRRRGNHLVRGRATDRGLRAGQSGFLLCPMIPTEHSALSRRALSHPLAGFRNRTPRRTPDVRARIQKRRAL